MEKKLYSIGELIDENIKLKEQIKNERKGFKRQMLYFLNMVIDGDYEKSELQKVKLVYEQSE